MQAPVFLVSFCKSCPRPRLRLSPLRTSAYLCVRHLWFIPISDSRLNRDWNIWQSSAPCLPAVRLLNTFNVNEAEAIQILRTLADAMTLMSDLGNELSAFKSAQHFSSWLCLCPGNDNQPPVKSFDARLVRIKMASVSPKMLRSNATILQFQSDLRMGFIAHVEAAVRKEKRAL
jgi:hypothetical protein